MADLRVCPIVEGHGEERGIRILIDRIWREIVGGEYVEVLRPIRQPRGKLAKAVELRRAVTFASSKLQDVPDDGSPRLVLVLLDADADLPCILGPRLQDIAREACHPSTQCACVLANTMYETWFVAAAESLARFLVLDRGEPPNDPEGRGCGKGWIKDRFKDAKYSETVDQPAMTAAMDLARARTRSPSFDKLCRELERCR